MGKGRSWVSKQLVHKERHSRNMQVLSGTGEGAEGGEDLSNRGKALWIFKVIACGSEVVASKCNYHVYLSADGGLVIIVLI